MKHPPKNASSRRESTGGSRDRSLIIRNSSAGSASAKTKRVNASLAAPSDRLSLAQAYPTRTRMNSGAESTK